MSTRVHELAKELGLKSQELLERIQNWGLEVKVSALASLDPSTVERIRELMGQPSTGKDVQNARPAPSSPSPAAPTVRSTPRPVASVPLSSAPAASSPAAAHGSSSAGRPAGPASTAGRAALAASGTTTAQPRPVAAVVSPAGARPAVPSASGAPAPFQPAAPTAASAAAPASGNGPGSPQESTPGASPARSVPLSSPPLARSGGGLASRLGSGPLAAHTPHRGTGIRPGGGGPALTPSAESRPSRTQGSSPAVPGGQEGVSGTASFQPLKRSDYMSSAGIRPPVQRATPSSSPPAAPARRPGDDALTEGARREQPSVPRRPLPPVAAPQAPTHRASSAPRPASHAAEGKTQRPEKRMTREEVLNLMRSGQLGTQPSPGSPPSGLRGGQPLRGPAPGASPRGERAGPGTGLMPGMPGRRSHTTAPGAPPYIGPATPAAPPPPFDEEE